MDSSQAKLTAEQVKELDENGLLNWIRKERPNLLIGDKVDKFREAGISGEAFSLLAGDVKAFQSGCNLPFGTCVILANLAAEVKKRSRQQAEDVEMSNAANMKIASPDLAADLILGPHVADRTETVTKLAELLDDQWVVHVRGTPSTGKTTLAYLLRKHYKTKKKPVVLFSRPNRKSNVSLASYLAEQCGKEGYYGIQLSIFDIIFIIDEAQTAYSDGDLWEFIKAKRDQRTGPKFCILTVFGSPSQGIRAVNDPTPDTLRSSVQVSILRSRRENSPDIRLFYDYDEFEDVLTKYCANPHHELPLEKAARTYLYEMTSGHPGAVISMLYYLYKEYRIELKNNVIEQITEDHLIEKLADDVPVFSSLTQPEYPVHRSFPVQEKLTVPAARVLSTVLLQGGNVPFNYDDDAMRLCFQEGWIHVGVTDKRPSSLICSLPSRLHEKFIEYFLTSMDPKPFPINKFPTLPELCIEVFKHFSKKSLLLNSAERVGSAAVLRPVEAQYRDEFYRVFKSLLGNGVGISSEWARGRGGRIDFRILDPKWGVEFLVDGTMTTLNEHYGRFQLGGKYHWWILEGLMSDWVVIDCRCSRPPGTTLPWPNLWHAVFAEDFSTLRILDAGNRVIMPQVCLLN